MFYFCLSSLRWGLRHARARWIPQTISFFQIFIIAVILVNVLEAFRIQSKPPTWTYQILLKPWDWALSKSTPLFTLIEGFASLLVIQAVGQICRWVVNNRSDTWMVLPIIIHGMLTRLRFWCQVHRRWQRRRTFCFGFGISRVLVSLTRCSWELH